MNRIDYRTKQWGVTALALTVLLLIVVGRWFIAVIPGAAFVVALMTARMLRRREARRQAERRAFWLKRLSDPEQRQS
jgi:MFS superfamily sulfate permease-like transporter